MKKVRYFVNGNGCPWIDNRQVRYILKSIPNKKNSYLIVYEDCSTSTEISYHSEVINKFLKTGAWREIYSIPFVKKELEDTHREAFIAENMFLRLAKVVQRDVDVEYAFSCQYTKKGRYIPFIKMSQARRTKLVNRILNTAEGIK